MVPPLPKPVNGPDMVHLVFAPSTAQEPHDTLFCPAPAALGPMPVSVTVCVLGPKVTAAESGAVNKPDSNAASESFIFCEWCPFLGVDAQS